MFQWFITGNSNMKRFIPITIIAIAAFLTASCGSTRSFMPTAVSTVKSVSFDELNLVSTDYEILNRIEAQASIVVKIDDESYVISDPDGTFKLEWQKDKAGQWNLEDYEGVLRAGYLANDYGNVEDMLRSPESIVRRIAIYRLINLVKEQGGDGIIEPIISTNVEDHSDRRNNSITFQSTVSGKVIRLKSGK